MMACVLDQVFKQCWPTMIAPPEELFLDFRQPAQSESVNTSSSKHGACIAYFQTNRGVPFKY